VRGGGLPNIHRGAVPESALCTAACALQKAVVGLNVLSHTSPLTDLYAFCLLLPLRHMNNHDGSIIDSDHALYLSALNVGRYCWFLVLITF